MFKKKQEVKLPPQRNGAEIDQEYSNACAQIGHAQMQIELHQSDINVLKDRCRQLNAEKNALPKPVQVADPTK